MSTSAAKKFFISRLQRFGIAGRLPGALPQAVALRTFGAVIKPRPDGFSSETWIR